METRSSSVSIRSDVALSAQQLDDLSQAAERMKRDLLPKAEIALLVTDKAGIKQLNTFFRSVQDITDVLSFPALELASPLGGTAAGNLSGHAGDIVLCWDVVLTQAKENGHSPIAEAAALLAHGMLHLCGYDHPDDASQREMDRLTRELCGRAGFEVERFGH